MIWIVFRNVNVKINFSPFIVSWSINRYCVNNTCLELIFNPGLFLFYPIFSQSNYKYSTIFNYWNQESVDVVLGIWTWGYSMAGSDRSVEILILVRILPFKGRECQLSRQFARRLQQYSKLSTYPSSLWPDVLRLKSSQISTKGCSKNCHSSFYLIIDAF